jgi:TPR repeat protein
MSKLGWCFVTGMGVPKDTAKAAERFKRVEQFIPDK